MKKAVLGVILALIVVISFGGCGSAEAQTRVQGDRWEYETIDGSTDGVSFVAKANKLGSAGWELVGVTAGSGRYGYAVFKRKLP